MSALAIGAGIVVLGGAIALGVWWFSADQRQKRAMRAEPQVAIGDATPGKTRIVGTVRCDAPIAGPLSGRPCAYYRVIVEERKGVGKNKSWVKIIDESDGVEFFMEDGSGRARVLVTHVRAVLEKDAKFSSGMFNDASMELDMFLSERGFESQGWVFNKDMRFNEGIIEAGERVCAVGTSHWEEDPEEGPGAGRGYRDARHPQRLVMDANIDGTPLLLSDHEDVTR